MKELNTLVALVVMTMVACGVESGGSCRTTELGHEYAGKVDKTKDGIPCQRWDSQSPHKHSVDAANFPDATLSDAANYCRNPGSTPGGPWCYTASRGTRWQSCDTPECTEWFLIKHVDSGLCLTTQGSKIRMWKCVPGATEEHWKWDGKHLINRYDNSRYGMYMDLNDFKNRGKTWGEVRIGTPHSGEDHLWTFSNGYLTNGCYTEKCGVRNAKLVPIETKSQAIMFFRALKYYHDISAGSHGGQVGAGNYYVQHDALYKWKLVPV